MQERGPFSELQTALVLYECLQVIASCHVSSVLLFPDNGALVQQQQVTLQKMLAHAMSQDEWCMASSVLGPVCTACQVA